MPTLINDNSCCTSAILFYVWVFNFVFLYTRAKISLAFGLKNVKILQPSASKIDKKYYFFTVEKSANQKIFSTKNSCSFFAFNVNIQAATVF